MTTNKDVSSPEWMLTEIAEALGIPLKRVVSVVALLKAGNTIWNARHAKRNRGQACHEYEHGKNNDERESGRHIFTCSLCARACLAVQ